jgi:DNA-binding SARP family transcriptional activator
MIDHDPPLYQLRTLGGLALWSDIGPTTAAATRPRVLVLLALACSAGPRGLTRERAAVILWPDATQAQSRNDLKQLVFVTRRALSHDVFADDPRSLVVNESVVASDVAAFHRAVCAERHEEAVALYAGAFLDGFHLTDRPELERLVESERARWAQRHVEALEALAKLAEARGDPRASVGWWRRLVAAEPLRDDYAMRFMGALADTGELSGALGFARHYAHLVRRELDSELNPVVSRFVESLPERARASGFARRSVLDISALGRALGMPRREHNDATARAG